MIFRSLAHAAFLALAIMFMCALALGEGFVFSPVGYAAILIAFFLEISGNRW